MTVSRTKQYLIELDKFMRDVVSSAPEAPEFKTMLRYPFGWVDQDGNDYDEPTGKRIRPLLLLICANATNPQGGWQKAIPAAAAVEILHNFSLVHDDVQDSSPLRHKRSTVWRIWNIANAINVGDTLFALSYAALARVSERDVPAHITLKCWSAFNTVNLQLTRGQHLDMRFETEQNVTVDEYISMIGGKSAALVATSAQLGALIGSENETVAQHFYDFGFNLGLAFQIRDDILGIWGDPEVTGKANHTDIISRKKSLPILYGLEKSETLAKLYQQEESNVEEIVELLDSVDALAYTQQSETTYYEKALQSLELATKGQPYFTDDLIELSQKLFQRQR